ncbi:MAG: DUF202 domain-containing protein [Alphaproteobacteria bacterium]|nr:MAG: DUF202 domain-containing protein [Alphaproteobacteria bacterium]
MIPHPNRPLHPSSIDGKLRHLRDAAAPMYLHGRHNPCKGFSRYAANRGEGERGMKRSEDDRTLPPLNERTGPNDIGDECAKDSSYPHSDSGRIASAANPHPDRTDLAIDRTVLANERTYAAWIRTGLAGMVSGLAIEKFMVELMPTWSIHLIAELLLVLSAIAFLVAAWRYTHLSVKIAPDIRRIPDRMVLTSALLLAAMALLAAITIW